MRRSVAVLVAVVMLGAFACSDDDDDATTDTTVSADSGDRLAQAKSVVVEYFQARAVNDHDRALASSDEAAALAAEWERAVNTIDGTSGTPYEVEPIPSPNVRVEMNSLTEDNGRWLAEGFIELGERPSGVASTTTTAPPEGQPAPPPTSFVTDLVFTEGDDGLVVADYRFDDVPYPASELYIEPDDSSVGTDDDDGGTTATTVPSADARVVLMHRDVDGSAQYLLDADVADWELDNVTYFDTTDPPAPPDTGITVEVFTDVAIASDSELTDRSGSGGTADDDVDDTDGDGDGLAADANTLVVRTGAFPATTEGTLRIDLVNPDDDLAEAAVDVTIPAFPEADPRPTNVIRDLMSETTTTTSTTTPTTESTDTTTGPPPESPTTSSTTSTSTTSTTTTTTRAP